MSLSLRTFYSDTRFLVMSTGQPCGPTGTVLLLSLLFTLIHNCLYFLDDTIGNPLDDECSISFPVGSLTLHALQCQFCFDELIGYIIQ